LNKKILILRGWKIRFNTIFDYVFSKFSWTPWRNPSRGPGEIAFSERYLRGKITTYERTRRRIQNDLCAIGKRVSFPFQLLHRERVDNSLWVGSYLRSHSVKHNIVSLFSSQNFPLLFQNIRNRVQLRFLILYAYDHWNRFYFFRIIGFLSYNNKIKLSRTQHSKFFRILISYTFKQDIQNILSEFRQRSFLLTLNFNRIAIV